MKKQILYSFLFICSMSLSQAFGQSDAKSADSTTVSKLFRSQENLMVKLEFSKKEIKKVTNDSTFMASHLTYQETDGSWRKVNADIRVRGNYRLNNCYFPPLKLKIGKSDRKGTIFEGNKKLKLVLPCSSGNYGNDYVVKEYLAYRLYEIVSPYHFKTRPLDITYDDLKGNKSKSYALKGFFIEDIEKVADRCGAKVFDRPIHPMGQGALASIRNAFFQFMIGNTDFSTSAQHNEKLLYVDEEFVPVPYDFDMSGLVNTNYSVVSVINGEQLPINSVEERLYRGFKRDPALIRQVRQEYLNQEDRFFQILSETADQFEDPKSVEEARNYLAEFFTVLKEDKEFEKEIIQQLRTK